MKGYTALHKQVTIIHWLIIAAVIIFSVSSTTGCSSGLFRRTTPQPEEVFYQAVALIEQNYMDPSDNSIKLDTSMAPDINTLIAQLDSSVQFRSKEDLAIMNNVSGGATGIGVILKKGSWHISKVFINSPAYQAGLRRGDKIEEINGESVEGLSELKLISRLQGKPGSEVAMKIVTPNNVTKILKITRQVINPGPFVTARLIENKIGYVRVSSFLQQTTSEVTDAVESLLKQDIQGLIVDLRNNGGGLLNSVTETAELFLPKKTPMVRLVTRNPKDEKTIEVGKKSHYKFPMAVIIDKNTSSGAELLAAILKEKNRAVLIGEKTMGKGSLRTVYPLKGGSALIMRTAYMQTAGGEGIEGRGVNPDAEVVLSDEETDKLYDKLESAADTNIGEISIDIQIKTAVALLADRIANNKPPLMTK